MVCLNSVSLRYSLYESDSDLIFTIIPGDVETMISLAASSIDALYDNAKPFDAFLKKQGMERILRETNLKLRAKHTIVPHVRICIGKAYRACMELTYSMSTEN